MGALVLLVIFVFCLIAEKLRILVFHHYVALGNDFLFCMKIVDFISLDIDGFNFLLRTQARGNEDKKEKYEKLLHASRLS